MSGDTFFHAVREGMQSEIGSHTFTPEEIVDFARQFDPQPFHLTQEAGEASHFGGLVASGWHTIAAWMRLNVEHRFEGLKAAAGFTGDLPRLGPSPGVRNIRWLHPVHAGDTITYRSTVIGKRMGKTPGWGMIMSRVEGFNQDGKQVLSMEGAARMPTEE